MRTLNSPLKRFAEFWWGDSGLSSFLILLFLIIFFSPFIDSSLARILITIFLALLTVSGIANIQQKTLLRVVAFVVAGIALILSILRHILPDDSIMRWWDLSVVAYLLLLVGVLMKQVFRDGPVTAHRVRGAVAVYLLIGLAWMFIYQAIVLFIPGAISFPASLTAHPGEPEHQEALGYFSFVTMTTLGYGDIVPVHPAARMFVIVQALIGQLYPATLLARLVSLQLMYRDESTDQNFPRESGKKEDG